ncbi:MAG TPA: glycogen-binding domain-containing protein [Gemmatimonadales bacterium]|nr:glycogen-binding domain-containing protein [Gemmatimonadales bacterium]
MTTVRYDGFLASGAASLTPALHWERRRAAVSARGTYLRFESGHRSVQGLLTASLFTPPSASLPGWRGELFLSAGGSSYADFASFWHATGETRVHYATDDRGAWVGGAAGRTSYGAAPRPVAVVNTGVWARRAFAILTLSASRSFIGDTVYSDVVSSLRASRGRLELNASVGGRLLSRGAGRGVYGDGSATLTLGGRTALFAAAGRYPTDPVSGSVAGRYASAGVRLWLAMPRPAVFRDASPSRPPVAADGDAPSMARLELRPAPDGVRLLLHAAGATHVDLAGDFTDWQAVALRPTGDDVWEATLPIASGLHRLNIRIDAGRWTAPAGTTRVTDEFGGEVGMVTVP